MDVISDLGGVLDVFVLLLGLLFVPIAQHFFNVDSINDLVIAKSSKIKRYQAFGKVVKKELLIKISFLNSIFLLFVKKLLFGLSCCKTSIRGMHIDKLLKLYDKGVKKIDESLAYERILKKLSTVKQHSTAIVEIDLDHETDEDESSSDQGESGPNQIGLSDSHNFASQNTISKIRNRN